MTRQVVLGDLIALAKMRRAGNEDLPILSMTMHGGLIDQADKFKKRIASADTSPYKRVSRDQLVVGFPIDEGVLSFQTLYDEAIVSPAYDVWDLRQPGLVASHFLERVLRSPRALAFYRSKLQGTTARRRTIPDDLFLSLPISLPDISVQVEVIAILAKADSIQRKRQQAIRLADEFLRSAFYDIFGDPVANNRNWTEREIAEIGKVTTGTTPSRDVDAYFGDAIEWIKSDNINTAGHWLTKAREGLSELGATVARTAPSGSTLMTCIAGSPSCIGNVAMTDRTVAFNQQINAVTPKAGIESEFVYALLLFSKGRVQATSTNSMKGMVSKGTLEKVRLIWPPADLQEKFVKLFKQVQKLHSRMEGAEASSLFSALQNKLLA